jgi:uncharacterized membrane protein
MTKTRKLGIKTIMNRLNFKFKDLFKSEYILLYLILLAGIFLRFKGMVFQSLWLDEITSILSSAPSKSLSAIISHYQGDPHPPLFFFILHYWMGLFGYNEFSARLLVVIIGSLSVLAAYFLGKECFNRNTGLIASVIVAFNYFNLRFSHEVRPYILLCLASTMSYTFFIRLIKHQTKKNIIFYSLSSAFMIYTHYYGIFVLLSQIIFLLFYFFSEEKISWMKILKSFTISGAIILILYTPWIPTILKMIKKKSHWIQKAPGPDFFIESFRAFLGKEPYLVVLFTGLILLLIFYFILPKEHRPFNENVLFRLNIAVPAVFCWLFFSLFLPYFRSITTIPMYINRYTTGTLPAVIILAAISIELIKSKTFKIMVIFSILLASTVNLFYHKDYYNRIMKAQWRSVVDLIIKEKKQKNNIFVFSNDPAKYQFYFDSKKTDIRVYPPDIKILEGILEKDKKDKEFWIINAESSLKYSHDFFEYLEKNFNRWRREKFYIVGATLWVHKSQDGNKLMDKYIEKVLNSSEIKEYIVWNKDAKNAKKLSPPLFPLSRRGEFSFDFTKEQEEAIITVRNIIPGKDDIRKITLGYEVNKKGLNMEMPWGKYIHFVVKASVSPNLMNKDNYFAISDFGGKHWVASEKSYFKSPDWRIYLISKKVRYGCSRLVLAAWLNLKSPEDTLRIRDVKIFVSEKPL